MIKEKKILINITSRNITYFKSKGWTWGGDWKKLKDGPHFQYDFGFDWKTLKARYDKGITIKDSNGITYVKI